MYKQRAKEWKRACIGGLPKQKLATLVKACFV